MQIVFLQWLSILLHTCNTSLVNRYNKLCDFFRLQPSKALRPPTSPARGVPNRSVLAWFSQPSQPTWTPTPTSATTTGMASMRAWQKPATKNLLDLYQRYSTASCCTAFSYKPLIDEGTGLPDVRRTRGCQTWRIWLTLRRGVSTGACRRRVGRRRRRCARLFE